MSYHQDWLMRQIEAITAMLGYLLTGKNPNTFQLPQSPQARSDTNMLYLQLRALTQQGKICEAENLLYEAMEDPDQSVLEAAVAFYAEINQLSDTQLREANFSRDEILSGLNDVCTTFGIPI